MPRIISREDCGNSPKNLLLQELTIAFAKRDGQWILDRVSDEIRWEIIGEKLIAGKEAFASALDEMKREEVEELVIHHVLSHGKAGAVDGIEKLNNGITRAFSSVIEFTNAKGTAIQEITSYRVAVK